MVHRWLLQILPPMAAVWGLEDAADIVLQGERGPLPGCMLLKPLVDLGHIQHGLPSAVFERGSPPAEEEVFSDCADRLAGVLGDRQAHSVRSQPATEILQQGDVILLFQALSTGNIFPHSGNEILTKANLMIKENAYTV